MKLTLQSYRNGKYLIHNVPYEKDGSGNFYVPSNVLKRIATLIETMAKHNVNEINYDTELETKSHLYKSAAIFELVNLDYYKKELNRTSSSSKKEEIVSKIERLENAINTLDLPSQELIHRKFLSGKEGKVRDSDVINSLKINRNMYYDLKQDALLRIGRYLYGYVEIGEVHYECK